MTYRLSYFISPEDSWQKSVSQSSPYQLAPQGQTDDSIEVTLNFDNINSNLFHTFEMNYLYSISAYTQHTDRT